MPSLRVRRMHAAEDPRVIAELDAALAMRWSRATGIDSHAHALAVAGMYAAMATEDEVARYVATVERTVRPSAAPDENFAATLLRIVLRLDEPVSSPQGDSVQLEAPR